MENASNGWDGIEATILIRANKNTSQVPIVGMTANSFVEDKEKCFESGMSHFLAKPVKLDQLSDLLNEITKI